MFKFSHGKSLNLINAVVLKLCQAAADFEEAASEAKELKINSSDSSEIIIDKVLYVLSVSAKFAKGCSRVIKCAGSLS
jgi:hypothetical protein